MNRMMAGLALVVMSVGAAGAADKPNLSGEWKANLEKSDFGVLPPPTSFTRTITHAEPAITFEDVQGTAIGLDRTERKYTTDGKQITFESQSAEVKSTATWDAGKLRIKSQVDVAGMKIEETITPSADGKTFQSLVHIATPQGDLEVKILFEKK